MDRSCGSLSAPLQWVTFKAARRERIVNDWVETRISDSMIAMIHEALEKRRSYGEPSTRAPTLKRADFVKKVGIDFWLLQIWAQLLTNFLYLRFAFTLQDHLAPMLLENFSYILNRWSCICSHCPFHKTKKMFLKKRIYIYIYKYTYIHIHTYTYTFTYIYTYIYTYICSELVR